MPNYKDTSNKVHFLDSAEFEHLLPVGCVAISDSEAALLSQAIDPNTPNPRIVEIKAELVALDMKRIRPLAEGDTEYLATINAQAVVLRAELAALTAA